MMTSVARRLITSTWLLLFVACGPSEDASSAPPKQVPQRIPGKEPTARAPDPVPAGPKVPGPASPNELDRRTNPPGSTPPANPNKPAPMFEIRDNELKGGTAFLDGDRFVCVDEEALVCIDLATGKRAWRYSFPNKLGRSQVVPSGRRAVLVGSQPLHLVSLDTGEAVYERSNPDLLGTVRAVDDLLICTGRGAAVYEIDTLKKLWQRDVKRPEAASVLLAEADGALIQTDGPEGSYRLEWVDLRSGKPRWTLPGPHVYDVRRRGNLLSVRRGSKVHAEINATTGALLYESQGRFIYPGSDQHRVLYSPGVEVQERVSGKVLWSQSGVRLLHFENDLLVILRGEEVVRADLATGSPLWTTRAGLNPKAARRFGELLVVHDGSEVVALHVSSGAVGWRQGRSGFAATTVLESGEWIVFMKSLPLRLLALRMKNP